MASLAAVAHASAPFSSGLKRYTVPTDAGRACKTLGEIVKTASEPEVCEASAPGRLTAFVAGFFLSS